MKDIRVHTIGKIDIKNIPEEEQNKFFIELYNIILQKKQTARKPPKTKEQ